MKRIFLLLLSVVAVSCPTLFAKSELNASELDAIIARARAVVGSSEALSAVKTLTFEADVFDGEGKRTSQIVLQFKRPYFVREVVRWTEVTPVDDFYYPEEQKELLEPKKNEMEVTVLSDGKEGVRIIRNKTEDKQTRVVLTADEVISRKDFSNANLDFYARIREGAGKTTLVETRVVDGIEQAFIEYVYPNGLKILRVFNTKTGALISTKANDETTFDLGEKILTGGLTFLDGSRSVGPDGKTKSVFKFTRISVNEELPDSLFQLSLKDVLLGK